MINQIKLFPTKTKNTLDKLSYRIYNIQAFENALIAQLDRASAF